MRWKVLLSGRVSPSIAQLTENTNVVRAINSKDLRGANEHARRGNGVDRLTSPTPSFTLVTEASFISTGIKHQLSSLAMKPSVTFQSYSQKLGESPRLRIRMPHRPGLDGILASWGNTVLEPLDTENRKAFAEGRRLRKGHYIDFIGNFDRSAKEGFPLYRISGGAGFIWAASFDQQGRGTLRLLAVDTSAFYSELVIAQSLPSQTRESIGAGSAGANVVRQRAEKAGERATTDSEAAPDEFEAAKRDLELAKTEIESLNAERETQSRG
jgi:hypothetical protein